MNEPLAHLEVHQRPGGRTVATLRGEIDLSNAEHLERRLNDAAQDTHTLTIDLTAIEYMDSQGVRILQHFVDRHTQGAIDLTIVASANSIASDIINITGIADKVPVIEP